MKIYTKSGDNGTTRIIGGTRILKSDTRIEASGTIDELISYLGLIKDQIELKEYRGFLFQIQNKLMVCESILVNDSNNSNNKSQNITEEDINRLETEIDDIEKEVDPLDSFIIPGGHVLISHIHIARTICRRAERDCIKAGENFAVNTLVIVYLNRLSDYLYMFARIMAKMLNVDEIKWNKNL